MYTQIGIVTNRRSLSLSRSLLASNIKRKKTKVKRLEKEKSKSKDVVHRDE